MEKFMQDIHGNTVKKNDDIYILDAAKQGSKSKRLLYGKVTEVTGEKCTAFVYENKRTYSKTSATVLLPKD